FVARGQIPIAFACRRATFAPTIERIPSRVSHAYDTTRLTLCVGGGSMSGRNRRAARAALVTGSIALMLGAIPEFATAQQPPPAPPQDDDENVITVTGSRIRAIDAQG